MPRGKSLERCFLVPLSILLFYTAIHVWRKDLDESSLALFSNSGSGDYPNVNQITRSIDVHSTTFGGEVTSYWPTNWTAHNPNICCVPNGVFRDMFGNMVEDMADERCGIVAIIFFLRKENLGATKNAIGFLLRDSITSLLLGMHTEVDWLVYPKPIHNVFGFEASNPRCFVSKNIDGISQLAFVAHTRVHPEDSLVPNATFYQTRISHLTTFYTSAEGLTDESEYGLYDLDPYILSTCKEHFQCSDGLYGFELHMDLSQQARVPRKNIQPVLFQNQTMSEREQPDAHLKIFIDFAAPQMFSDSGPLVSVIDMDHGLTIGSWRFQHSVDDTPQAAHCYALLKSGQWKGSTQVVEIHPNDRNPVFFSILHKEQIIGGKSSYKHISVLLSSVTKKIPNYGTISVPLHCMISSETDLEPEKLHQPGEFALAMGLIPMKPIAGQTRKKWNNTFRFALSYETQDHIAKIRLLELHIHDHITYQSKFPIRGEQNFFAFWTGQITSIHAAQFRRFLQSVALTFPDNNIFLFAEENAFYDLRSICENLKTTVLLIDWDYLLLDTPAYTLAKDIDNNSILAAEKSDLFRLAALWKWGGSYSDMDDIFIRPMPDLESKSNLLPLLEWPNSTVSDEGRVALDLIDGEKNPNIISGTKHPFHIQNDPMLNFKPGNKFIYEWLQEVARIKPTTFWGQKVPTDLIRKRETLLNHVTLIPQYHLLLHPAYSNMHGEGPMFPPFDLRLPSTFPSYDHRFDQKTFIKVLCQTVCAHSYIMIKNPAMGGVEQRNPSEQMDIRGWAGQFGSSKMSQTVRICANSCD